MTEVNYSKLSLQELLEIKKRNEEARILKKGLIETITLLECYNEFYGNFNEFEI